MERPEFRVCRAIGCPMLVRTKLFCSPHWEAIPSELRDQLGENDALIFRNKDHYYRHSLTLELAVQQGLNKFQKEVRAEHLRVLEELAAEEAAGGGLRT
jgi:hypothetical protein